MDDQRLEEIAEKTFWEIESHIYANRDTLAKMVIGAAIREALSSQEEELRKVREELRSMLRERRATETASCQGYEAAVARAESAESESAGRLRVLNAKAEELRSEWIRAENAVAELHRLRDAVEPIRLFVQRERGIRDSITRGGQHVGTTPLINPSALKRMEEALAPVDRLLAGEITLEEYARWVPDSPQSPTIEEMSGCIDFGATTAELLADPVEAFVLRVNARAEADMLKGGPVTGAHHRALEAEIAAYRDKVSG